MDGRHWAPPVNGHRSRQPCSASPPAVHASPERVSGIVPAPRFPSRCEGRTGILLATKEADRTRSSKHRSARSRTGWRSRRGRITPGAAPQSRPSASRFVHVSNAQASVGVDPATPRSTRTLRGTTRLSPKRGTTSRMSGQSKGLVRPALRAAAAPVPAARGGSSSNVGDGSPGSVFRLSMATEKCTLLAIEKCTLLGSSRDLMLPETTARRSPQGSVLPQVPPPTGTPRAFFPMLPFRLGQGCPETPG